MSASLDGSEPPRAVWRPPVPIGTVVAYVVIVALLLATSRASLVSSFPFINQVLAILFLAFLARTLSATYIFEADRFTAWRLVGTRRVSYRDVRRIEYGNLRELSPVSFAGAWGWRGRMWSPVIGRFDSVYTVTSGVVITGGDVPLFVSPRDPAGFARELSRRVRSYVGPLEIDVGAPPARE